MILASYSSMARIARRVATAASLALAVALNMVCCTAPVPRSPIDATTIATITSISVKPAASQHPRRAATPARVVAVGTFPDRDKADPGCHHIDGPDPWLKPAGATS